MRIPLVVLDAAGPVSGPDARRVAHDELARREYRRESGTNPVTRVLDWVGHRITDITSNAGGSHALLLLAALFLVIAIVVLARNGVPTWTGRGDNRMIDDPLAPLVARDHRRLAEQLTAQGNHRAALREWLRAAIATVEERRILPPRPGRTGAATAREAGPLVPSAADDLRAATTAFDQVWFGGRAADASDVRRARAAADGVAHARITESGSASSPGGLAVPW